MIGWNGAWQILAGAAGSLGFAILFNVRGSKLVAVTLGGGAAWLLYLLLVGLEIEESMCYFIVAITASLYAEAMARYLKAPATVFISPCLVPLIPGASLYYSMVYAMEGEAERFAARAVYTFRLAAALALGVIASAVIMKLITKLGAWISAKRGAKDP